MAPSFNMRLSQADAPPSQLTRSPVKGSAHHSLQGTKQSKPRSENEGYRPLTHAEAELELSNFSLSLAEKGDVSTNASRIPVSSFAPTLPQHGLGPNPKGHRLSFTDLRSSQRWRSSGLAPRRDSVHKSSAGHANDDDSSFRQSQSSDCASSAVNTHTNIGQWSNAQRWGLPRQTAAHLEYRHPASTELDEDTTAGAESTQQWDSDEPNAVDHARSYSGESWDAARAYTRNLGVPHLQNPSLSPKLSVEGISDAGDQLQLRQERQKRTSLHPEDSFDEDLDESLASLPPLGSRYALQQEILDARQVTRNNEGQLKRFIPRGKLSRVITVEAVTKELQGTLSQVQPRISQERIQYYAKQVCKETQTQEIRKGKAKIKSFRKIFALLVLVEAASSIIHFVDEDVSDQDLPLTLVRHPGTSQLYRKENQEKGPLMCFEDEIWGPVKLEMFQEYQWCLLAPFFSPPDEGGVVKNYMLQDEHILPYVVPDNPKDQIIDKIGGYGKVIMVDIHPDHHNFPNPQLCERGFAVKQQLHDDDREAYKKEIDILMKFSGRLTHPHVVSLLATYEQFRKFHLVFYRAEGDLFEFWKIIKPRPEMTHRSVTWMATQCMGIAEGLSKLHRLLSFTKPPPKVAEARSEDPIYVTKEFATSTEKLVRFHIPPLKDRVGTDSSLLSNGVKERATSPIKVMVNPDEHVLRHAHRFHGDEDAQLKQFGRHGDINPSNILWYDDGNSDETALKGTLKITDFGQAEVNSMLSKTGHRSVANTLTYRPPECDVKSSMIRQSYDIWCLGCVYLEFVTWLLGGSHLVKRFARLRSSPDALHHGEQSDTFFEVTSDPETRQTEFMVKPAVTQFIGELHEHPNCTAFVHDFLNMVEYDMLIIDSRERKPCTVIARSLDKMHVRCVRNEDYAATSSPWCKRKPTIPRSVRFGPDPVAGQTIEYGFPSTKMAKPTLAPAVQPIAPRRTWLSRIPRRNAR